MPTKFQRRALSALDLTVGSPDPLTTAEKISDYLSRVCERTGSGNLARINLPAKIKLSRNAAYPLSGTSLAV